MNSLYVNLNNLRKKDCKKYDFLINLEKEKTVNFLAEFLNENLHCNYLYSIIDDVNGNSADAIVLKDSKLFENELEGHDLLHHDVEELIDDRYAENKGEIIILELNGASKDINLLYLIESVKSKHISYSQEIKEYIEMFLKFLIKKRLEEYS